MNIMKLFVSFLKKICLTCHFFYNENEILKFNKCGCTNCDKCLIKKIKRATNGLILLSDYEKSTYKQINYNYI